MKLDRTEAVYEAILSRPKVPAKDLRASLDGLAALQKVKKVDLLLKLIEQRDSGKGETGSAVLGRLLSEQPAADLQAGLGRIETLARNGKSAGTRQLAYAAWITAIGSSDDAFLAASTNKNRLRDFLDAIPSVTNNRLRGSLYTRVQPLINELPPSLSAESTGTGLQQNGIKVDYFYPSANNVALETLAKMTPKASGIVPEIVMNVPQKKQSDKFALRFTGTLQVPRTGNYTFFTTSDDGSRLYIGKKLVVNNDGLHGMVERSGRIKLAAGPHPLVVTYFDNGGGDGLVVNWRGPRMKKQKIAKSQLSIGGGGETLHDVAIRALTSIPGHASEKVIDLSALVKSGKHRVSAIRGLRTVPAKQWPQKEIRPLVDNLVGYLSELPAAYRTGPPAQDALALARSLSSRLPADQAKALRLRLENLNVRVIAIGTVPHRMIYDKERIAVQAGKPVEFRFSNTDNMPHNFAITQPGALEEIGMLAEATARTPDAMARHYIPKSPKIMLASRLLQSGQTQALSFEAPTAPGIYPYVCTYPGHWRRMYGAIYVVSNLEEYQANPTEYLAAHKLPLKDELLKYNTRGREWKYSELASAVQPLPGGRSFDVGKQLFKVSNCVACHRLNNEGQVFGPDLTKLDKKKQTAQYILQSLLEPSRDVDKKFQSHIFALDSGKVITGMVLEETGDVVKVVIDPLAKGKPTLIKKASIDDRSTSKTSIMPKGLLNKLSREEILDLVAYIFSRGDKKNPLFKGEHDDH